MSVILLFVFLALPGVKADDASLTVTPDKCVALRKGQTCYQSVRIKFMTSSIGDYCLLIVKQPSPLHCWTSVGSAEYRYPLESSSAVEFEVVDAAQTKVADTRVTISWVYKQSRSRSRWRLF